MTKCPNCQADVLPQYTSCPYCSHDLRQSLAGGPPPPAMGSAPQPGAVPPAGGSAPQSFGAAPLAGGSAPQPGAAPPAGGGAPQGFGAAPPAGGSAPQGFGAAPPAGGSPQGFGAAPPPGGGGFGAPPSGGAGFGPPPAGGPGFGVPPGPGGFASGADYGPPVNTTPALIAGAVVTFFCCLPGGLYVLHLANQAKTQAASGDPDGANAKLKQAYIVAGICAVIGPFIQFALIAAQNN